MSLFLVVLAALCHGIKELHIHSKLKWSKGGTGFWDEDSYKRKYKWEGNYVLVLHEGRANWYYRTFNIKYVEKFPLSATLLSFLTDGYHLMQFCFTILLSLAIALWEPIFDLWYWNFIVVWLTFLISFSTFYRLLQRPNPPAK